VDSSGLAPTAVHTCSLQLCGTQRPQPCPIRACLCPIHRLAAAPLHAPPWQVPKGGGRRSQRGQVILLEVRGGQEGANHPPLHFPWGHERGEWTLEFCLSPRWAYDVALVDRSISAWAGAAVHSCWQSAD